MSALLPRLDRESVADLFDALGVDGRSTGFEGTSVALPTGVTYARTGGAPVRIAELGSLRGRIEDIARASGWPEAGGIAEAAAFDARVAAALATDPLFGSGEAHRDDVWACIAVCVLPHLVLWRFGHRAERFRGGIRNTFQRLWVRGCLLDRGEVAGEVRWALLEALGEDALFNLTERPALAADRRLSRAIAEGWIRCAERIGKGAMEPVMRRVTMQLRLLNEIRLLSVLNDTALDAAVDDEFERARASVSSVSSR